MTTRGTIWSVTINNPTADDDECVNLARQKGWQVLGQREQGDSGTEHYQLAVKTPQVRFSALKKAFPRAHIELGRSAPALLKYVEKEQSRVGDLPTQQDKYPSLSRYWDLIFRHLNGLDKDGLDYVALEEGKVRFYRDERDRLYRKAPLMLLDEATRSLIQAGYHVEGIGGNPNTRSQWKLYSESIIMRSYNAVKNLTIETQHANDDQTSQRSGTTQELSEYGGAGSTPSCSSPPLQASEDCRSACSQGSDQG